MKPNGLPILVPMLVKKGDTVQVISGEDKGKVGEVLQVSGWRGACRQAEGGAEEGGRLFRLAYATRPPPQAA